jgi:hypothetical protein
MFPAAVTPESGFLDADDYLIPITIAIGLFDLFEDLIRAPVMETFEAIRNDRR